MNKQLVVYDVEIANEVRHTPGGWDNPFGMGFASAVVYSYGDERYHFFLHERDRERLLGFLYGKIAVSFNGVRFDSRNLLGNDRVVVPQPDLGVRIASFEGDTGWLEYDIMLMYVMSRFQWDFQKAQEELGKSYLHDGSFSLNGLARGTLGDQKSGEGAHAPILYQQERYAELLEYNLHDVELTKRLFDYILDGVVLTDGKGRLVNVPAPKLT